jgi:hypothetical protein
MHECEEVASDPTGFGCDDTQNRIGSNCSIGRVPAGCQDFHTGLGG